MNKNVKNFKQRLKNQSNNNFQEKRIIGELREGKRPAEIFGMPPELKTRILNKLYVEMRTSIEQHEDSQSKKDLEK